MIEIIFHFREGHAECMQLLLKKGANPDICDKGGRTPLYWTSFHAHAECARILKEGGAKDLVGLVFCNLNFNLSFEIFPPGIAERANRTSCSNHEGSH